jgi:hypothetical protein
MKMIGNVPLFNQCVGAWRSLVAYLNGVQRVGGSNPLAPTNGERNRLLGGFFIGGGSSA